MTKHPLRQLAQILIEIRELKRPVRRSKYEDKNLLDVLPFSRKGGKQLPKAIEMKN